MEQPFRKGLLGGEEGLSDRGGSLGLDVLQSLAQDRWRGWGRGHVTDRGSSENHFRQLTYLFTDVCRTHVDISYVSIFWRWYTVCHLIVTDNDSPVVSVKVWLFQPKGKGDTSSELESLYLLRTGSGVPGRGVSSSVSHYSFWDRNVLCHSVLLTPLSSDPWTSCDVHKMFYYSMRR